CLGCRTAEPQKRQLRERPAHRATAHPATIGIRPAWPRLAAAACGRSGQRAARPGCRDRYSFPAPTGEAPGTPATFADGTLGTIQINSSREFSLASPRPANAKDDRKGTTG